MTVTTTRRVTATRTATVRLRPLRTTCPAPLRLQPDDWHELPALAPEAPTLDLGLDEEDDDFGPRHTSTWELPDAGPAARAFAQALAEVLTAHRPAAQLTRATSLEIGAAIGRLAPRAPRAGGGRGRPGRLRSIHVGHPSDGVAEVAATVVIANRVHAVAFRMTGRDRRWLVDRLQVG